MHKHTLITIEEKLAWMAAETERMRAEFGPLLEMIKNYPKDLQTKNPETKREPS